MYIGIGATLSILFITISFLKKSSLRIIIDKMNLFLFIFLIIGLSCTFIALGDFSKYSPYHIIHLIPGMSQTRVSSRWLIFTLFSLLMLFSFSLKKSMVINLLLLLSVLELFFTFGPPRFTGANEFTLAKSNFSSVFTEYDNNFSHLDSYQYPLHSYYYSTRMNIGQIYADNSLVDTLHKTKKTVHCGKNTNPNCNLILTDNATITYWSPNEIRIKRTGVGPVELNMNVDGSWRVNNVYIFAPTTSINPSERFYLSDTSSNYTLSYSPKYSSSWVKWKLNQL